MIKPYNTSENKKKEIKKMFNNIAKSYDTLNRILSLGIDVWWRKKAVKQLNNPKIILDVATGTADFAIAAAKNTNATITGIDISDKMLEIGEQKIKKLNLENRIILKLGDAEETTFKENSFISSYIPKAFKKVREIISKFWYFSHVLKKLVL